MSGVPSRSVLQSPYFFRRCQGFGRDLVQANEADHEVDDAYFLLVYGWIRDPRQGNVRSESVSIRHDPRRLRMCVDKVVLCCVVGEKMKSLKIIYRRK